MLKISFKFSMQHKRGLVLFWTQAWAWLSFRSFLQLRSETSTCLPLLWVSCQNASSVHTCPLSGSFLPTGSRSVWSPASSGQHSAPAVCLWHPSSSYLEQGMLFCTEGTAPLLPASRISVLMTCAKHKCNQVTWCGWLCYQPQISALSTQCILVRSRFPPAPSLHRSVFSSKALGWVGQAGLTRRNLLFSCSI